jgi:hypothetical protein
LQLFWWLSRHRWVWKNTIFPNGFGSSGLR